MAPKAGLRQRTLPPKAMRREKSACSREIIQNLKNVPHLQTCNLQVPAAPWKSLLPVTTEPPRCLLFFRQFPEVSHQFLYFVWFNLRAKSRHLSFALGDHFSQLLIGLLLNFRGTQILRMECLAGCGVAAAIGRVTLDAVRLENFGGLGLGLHCGWQSQAEQDAC